MVDVKKWLEEAERDERTHLTINEIMDYAGKYFATLNENPRPRIENTEEKDWKIIKEACAMEVLKSHYAFYHWL